MIKQLVAKKVILDVSPNSITNPWRLEPSHWLVCWRNLILLVCQSWTFMNKLHDWFLDPKNYRVPLLFIVILWVRAKRAELTTLFRVLLSHERIDYMRTHLLLHQRNNAQRSTVRRITYQFSSKTFIYMVECLKGNLTHNPLNTVKLFFFFFFIIII